MSRTFGVDIATFNGDVDIGELRRAGAEFVIVRCGGADDPKLGYYTDPRFERNYAACKREGMPVGAYYLLRATDERKAREEARHCLSLIEGRQFEYPIYLDVEHADHVEMGEADRRRVINAWLDEMGDGWLLGVYTWKWLLPSGVDCETWFCHWKSEGPGECGMWQFGGETNELRSTSVGPYGNMDQNYCYVDYPAFVRERGLNGFAAEGDGMTLRERVVEKARSQLGVRYYSMHEGPRGSAVEGWGCAMFYAWCLNEVLGTGYYGSCYNFAGDALGHDDYDQGGGEFEFVSALDAQPGDAVIYGAAGYDGTDSDDYGHIAMYVGGGNVIGAMGRGKPGDANYLNIGISETPVSKQSLAGVTRYIRCKRLASESARPKSPSTGSYTTEEMVWVNQKVTVRTDTLNVRDRPSVKTGAIKAQYRHGDVIYLDGIVLGDGYVWGSYKGATSGQRRYVALGDLELAQ